jgi:SAM-dependent methyltransferase
VDLGVAQVRIRLTMNRSCSICGAPAKGRDAKARSGKQLTIWQCAPCEFEFLAHDPTADIAAGRLDDSRLTAAGLDIPTLERDFANGLAQSRPYLDEYLDVGDEGANVLEIGCSWGYFLKLARDAGVKPFGVELNAVRARYVNEALGITCDVDLESCEARGTRFRKIFLFYVLEYIPDPVRFLQRLVDLLDDGGWVIAITPNLDDALKDLWRNEAFRRFYYDEHAINRFTPCSLERVLDRVRKRRFELRTRQGYSFVNHVSWFLTHAPRTTGVVGGDNFMRDIVALLRAPEGGEPEGSSGRRALSARLADLIADFDVEYRRTLEEAHYGNQIRFSIQR